MIFVVFSLKCIGSIWIYESRVDYFVLNLNLSGKPGTFKIWFDLRRFLKFLFLLQAILFVLIRPVSRNLYRRINRSLAELLWLQLIWLVDWWAGVQVK